jgi:hypothetical protein
MQALAVFTLLVVVATIGACDGRADRDRAFAAVLGSRRTTPASLLADSAAGDSAALRSLPPALQDALDVGDALSPAALRDTAQARCDQLRGAPNELRPRLRAKLPDGTALVLFARADQPGGTLRRVELVRRTANGGQRGFIWRADEDETSSVEWPFGRGEAPETTVLPRGGPVPRALRALGRRLLVLPCGASPAEANPFISDTMRASH